MFPKILEAHNQTHLNLKQFVCDVCNKGFNQMSQLKNHAVIHLDPLAASVPSWAKPKQCDICNKMFSDSKSLKKHVQAIHSKLKPYICQVRNNTDPTEHIAHILHLALRTLHLPPYTLYLTPVSYTHLTLPTKRIV